MDENQISRAVGPHVQSVIGVVVGAGLSFVFGIIASIINYRRDKALKEREKTAAALKAEQEKLERTKAEQTAERREAWRDYKRDVALKIQELDDGIENQRLAVAGMEQMLEGIAEQVKEIKNNVEQLYNHKNENKGRLDALEPKVEDVKREFDRLRNSHDEMMVKGGHRK